MHFGNMHRKKLCRTGPLQCEMFMRLLFIITVEWFACDKSRSFFHPLLKPCSAKPDTFLLVGKSFRHRVERCGTKQRKIASSCYCGQVTRFRVDPTIGSFSNDDGDGNQDVKKSNRFITQNNNFARVSRFFVHFFTVLARLRRENA